MSPTVPSAARPAGTSPRRAWGEKEPVDFSQFVPTSSSRPPPSERAGSNGTSHAGSNGANPANGERAAGFGASLMATRGVGGRSEPPPSGPPPRPQAPDELAAWEAILARVRAKNAHFASIFEHAAPLSVGADGVLLGYAPGAFLADQADHPDGRALLARAASDHFGAETPVALDSAGRHREVQTLADRNAAVAAARLAAARKRVEDHPLVVAAREVLGAELREVRLP